MIISSPARCWKKGRIMTTKKFLPKSCIVCTVRGHQALIWNQSDGKTTAVLMDPQDDGYPDNSRESAR